MRLFTRPALKRLAILVAVLPVILICCWLTMMRMPLRSFRGNLPPLTEKQTALRDELHDHVWKLAGEIGIRHVTRPGSMSIAADYIEGIFTNGGHKVTRQSYTAAFKGTQELYYNIEAEIPGTTRPDEIVVIGAHYDSHRKSPGADDNASGVAALLVLANSPALQHPARTLRFLAFANEETPFAFTRQMGSHVYAQRCRARGEKITAMVSLESIGYYDTSENSQEYPLPFALFYPSRADFIAFVSRMSDGALVRRSLKTFRSRAQFPSEGCAPPILVRQVTLSDHWCFWWAGYSAIMVTDTTRLRSPYIHEASDRPETLDFDRMARVVDGLEKVIAELADN